MKNIVCCALVRVSGGRKWILAMQRRPTQSYPCKWSIPGGKVEPGETLRYAAEREMREEIGVSVSFENTPFAIHEFEDKYRLHYMRAIAVYGEPQNLDGMDMRWVSHDQLDGMDWLKDDLEIARTVTL